MFLFVMVPEIIMNFDNSKLYTLFTFLLIDKATAIPAIQALCSDFIFTLPLYLNNYFYLVYIKKITIRYNYTHTQ